MTERVTKRAGGRAFRAIATLALPMGLANAASMLVPAVDAWAMGSLGRDALAGGGLGAGILSATMLVTGGVLAIVSPLVAEARTRAAASHSAPAPAGGERAIVGSAIVVAVALGALSTAALVLSSDALFEILGAPAAVARPGGAYLRAAAPSLVPALVAAAMRQALNASGRARHVLVASLAVLAAKAVANVGVVTVLRDVGTPALGVAAVAAQLLMAGVLARTARVEIGRPSSAGVRLVLRLGLPIGVTTGLEVAFFALSGAPIARLGADALAAHEIALQTLFLAFVIPLTFAQATSIRVAAGVGGASPAEVRAAAAAGVTLSLACAGIVALALAAGAPALAAAAAGAAPSALTARLLRLAAVVHLFDALQVSLAFVLRGLRDTRAPAAICVVTYGFLGPGLALAMIRTAPWAGAVWYAFTVTLAVTALAYGFRLHSRLQALAHH